MKVLAVLFVAIASVCAGGYGSGGHGGAGHGGEGKWYGPGSGVVSVSGDGSAVVAGPSGKVSTSNHGHGDGLGAWGGWAGYGAGLVGAWNGGLGGWGGYGGAWGGHGGAWGGLGLVGSGHEGQWVPELNEKFYDDGSYRPEHHYGHGAYGH